MDIQWHGRNGTGRFSFSATPGDYDGVPAVDRLYVDRDMLIVSSDVLSLSGFLAFAPYCAGRLTLPKEVSPELVTAMQEFASPSWLHVDSVDVEPKAAPQGEGKVLLADSLTFENVLPNSWGSARNTTLSVADSSQWAGYLLSSELLIVGSNARTVALMLPRALYVLPFISVALLFMESIRCSTLVVADSFEVDDEVWHKLVRLVKACNYSLLRESELREWN
ncbi:hypothetical protein M3F59_01720 [Brachybacterium muris]|uniref:hypothetical protein n=1 Tax=Brachybacterium muris TaxID=219301 RepID=UPI00223A931D|nr:hypothetical protein [Brachybacterium muris]MCT2260359.1 hypothetical protein [Brachybacterium muris]